MGSNKLYLVTGGAGFIGSHLAETLVGRGQRVRVLDNLLTGKKENLAAVLPAVDFIQGDIRDLEACRMAVQGVDYVLHEAALPSVPRSVADPILTNAINITGTLNMLLAARDAGVRSFVFASSSSVYGDNPSLPKKEGREGVPLSPYAVSKMAGEKYSQAFHSLYGLKTVALRYFNVFGPRQDPFSQYAAVVPQFIVKMLRGERPVIFGDGKQSRDFTYIDNIMEANLLAAESPEAAGRILNVACGEKTTVNALASALNAILETSLAPIHEAERPGDVRHSYADVALAREVLRFRPSTGFSEGLKKTVAWHRERS